MSFEKTIPNDRFAEFLKFDALHAELGLGRARAVVLKEHLNGAGIAHGGFLFSLADYSSALATNVEGRVALTSTALINYLQPASLGDVLIAECKLSAEAGKNGVYTSRITNESGEKTYCIFESRIIYKQ